MISTHVICLRILLLIFYLSNFVIYGQQIKTKQGDIKGIKASTINGREVNAYLGIPYAKPPVGELRFQNPVAFGSWTGVLDASKDGSKCLQGLYIFGGNGTVGSEDCLFLNVYVPARIPKGKKLPVMVFIHGGGFEVGDGTSSSVRPDYLLDKDIILVAINYRLGPLGFASTEDAEIPGNYGLKDQVLALKWVQQYIADYGGNPDSVTIFGESAGGASVHYLMISPLAKGLFHRAIPMSGTSHCPWAIRAKGVAAQRTKKLASLVGCPTEPSKFLLDCLRQISPVLLIEMLPKYQIWEKDPMVIFPPVIEPKGIEGAFLTENPINVKTSIPMMIGVTKDEGAMRIALFYLGGTLEQRLLELEERFSEIGPLTLMIDDTAEKPVEFAETVRNFYFGKNKIGINSIQSVVNMYTDSWFFHCTSSAMRMHTGPAYLYLFAHRGKHSITDELTKSNINYGVCHGDEIQYLLGSKKNLDSEQQVHYQVDDKKMVNTMVDLWTNFAIHGNPTPEGSKVKWDKTSPAELNYFHIEGGALKMEKHLFSERDQFWKNLHKRFNPVTRKSVNKGGEL